jgi:hypothetical protein
MRLRPLFLIFAALLALGGCGTQGKTQPDGTMVGTMTTGALPEVAIDGKVLRLSPGARIYNAQKLTITPNQVPPNSRVRYKLDASGNVNQVWLLPPER